MCNRWVYDSGINMEEDVLEKLRTVFNVCDERNEGYISVEHFKDLAKEHFGQFGDDEVRRVLYVFPLSRILKNI